MFVVRSRAEPAIIAVVTDDPLDNAVKLTCAGFKGESPVGTRFPYVEKQWTKATDEQALAAMQAWVELEIVLAPWVLS